MMGVEHITNPKVRAFITKKKQEKQEAKRFRQTGGERGAAARAAREAKGIHGKLDLEEGSEVEMEEVNAEKEKVKAHITNQVNSM